MHLQQAIALSLLLDLFCCTPTTALNGPGKDTSTNTGIEIDSVVNHQCDTTMDSVVMGISPVDSHLHVYSNGDAPFPLEQKPPQQLADAQVEHLWAAMSAAGVAGALIVQPINHGYDHSYVASVLADSRYSGRLKGMCLLDPHADDEYLPRLKAQGFVAVRFNPYKFDPTPPTPVTEKKDEEANANTNADVNADATSAGGEKPNESEGEASELKPSLDTESNSEGSTAKSNDNAGEQNEQQDQQLFTMRGPRAVALFRQAGKLGMPVGFMCFKGLNKHLEDIVVLMEASPETVVIIDHWGFFLQDGEVVEESFEQLLALAKYKQVHVKLSAAFRNSIEAWPHRDLLPRLKRIAEAYGAERLMWGSDFPWVRDHYRGISGSSGGGVDAGYVEQAFSNPLLLDECFTTNSFDRHAVLRGTADKLFGAWPSTPCENPEDMMD